MSRIDRSAAGRRSRASRKSRARRYAEYAATFVILLAILVVVARFDGQENRVLTGQTTVNDGDSLTIAGERIRLRGIDAPEYSQTCRRGGETYACGQESRRALRQAIGSAKPVCEGWERDKYDRLLAECYVGKINLNHLQVVSGWAVSYGNYVDAERTARNERRGIWAGEFERPRQWRESHGGMADVEHAASRSIWNWLRGLHRW